MSDSGYDTLTFKRLLLTLIYETGYPVRFLKKDFRGELSFEELIKSTVSTIQKWPKLEQYMRSIEKTFKRKNDSIAKALRKEGNSYYLKSNLEMALMKFNESFKFSLHPPIEDVSGRKQNSSYKELTFAYANRAAVLFEMGLYSEACNDIRRAVNHGYSKEKQSISIGRYCKSLIYIHLKENPQSPITTSIFDAIFEKTETDLDLRLSDEQRKLITDHKFDVKKAANNKHGNSKYFEVPKIDLDGEHPHILGLSNKVEFAANVKRGSYLIAGEDIFPGTLLALDPGFFTTTLYTEYVRNYCSACNKPCKLIFVPCHQCTSAVFCNEECRDEAFQSFHHYECSVLPLLDTLKMGTQSYMTLRLIASLGYSEIYDYVKILEREEETKKLSMAKRKFSPEGIYDPKSYRSVYYLTDHKEKRTPKDLFERSYMAVVMTFVMRKYSTFFGEESLCSEQSVDKEYFDEREMLIAKLILRHMMSMQVNATENSYWDISPCNVKTIGASLQCLFSLFGHSCNPNAFITDFHTIRSIAFIPKGTEITISYTLPFSKVSKQQRQADLLNRYYFTCDCIACVEDWIKTEEDLNEVVDSLRVKCMFGCKNGTLNKFPSRCTKCSKGFNKENSLYSETFLKHINRIIYGSGSESPKSIQRDLALTAENFFPELHNLIETFLSNNWLGIVSDPFNINRKGAYDIYKVIYLFDKYCDSSNNQVMFIMRELLKKFNAFSYNITTK